MMPRYGLETETKTVGANNSTETLIKKLTDYHAKLTLKRYSIRVKVRDKHQEMVEFLVFTDTIEKKRKEGVLVNKDEDPLNKPTFVIEFPNTDIDGSYFIVRSHTELVL